MHDARMMPDALKPLATAALMVLAAGACHAQDTGWDGRHDLDLGRTDLTVSPYTHHFSGREGHTAVYALGATRVDAGGRQLGAFLFQNSFGQPSAYVFTGHEYVEPWGLKNVYYTWTAGLIYGYKGEHKDEIKPNLAGFSPAIIPSLGYQISPSTSVEVVTLGFAALMFNLNIKMR